MRARIQEADSPSEPINLVSERVVKGTLNESVGK